MTGFAQFDRRGYRTVPAAEGYDGWAPTYDASVLDAMDLALLARLEVDWCAVAAAADLGCGTGRTGSWLRERGVGAVDGIDVSAAMLEQARARGAHRSLRQGDLRASGLPGAAYDLAISCLVDEHLPQLAPLYAEAARLLRPGGAFALVGYHPFFAMAAGMPTHYDDPVRGTLAIETHVHLFGEHVEAARSAGLVAVELHEAVVDDAWIARKPKWERHRGWPVSFAWRWRLAPT